MALTFGQFVIGKVEVEQEAKVEEQDRYGKCDSMLRMSRVGEDRVS